MNVAFDSFLGDDVSWIKFYCALTPAVQPTRRAISLLRVGKV